MEIDEKELWESLQNCGFDVPEIKLIMHCIESAKKPDALAEKVELNEEALIEFFSHFKFVEWECGSEYNFVKDLENLLDDEDGNSYGGKELAKAICAKFRPANVDKLAEQNKRLRELIEYAAKCVWDGRDIDGGDFQDKAVELGIFVPVTVPQEEIDANPEKYEQYREYDTDTLYHLAWSEEGKQALGGKTEGESNG